MVWLKGIAMGAADVVPGVSGGTIAFITGIYAELLNSIRSLDFEAARLLFTGRFHRFWTKVNGTFLFSLLLGIAISLFSLARLMTWLLANEPIAVWSFFMGMILTSALLVARQVGRWSVWTVVSLVAGIATGYAITALNPTADIADPAHKKAAGFVKNKMATYREAQDLINIGAYQKGSNPDIDQAIKAIGEINALLTQEIEERFTFEKIIDTLVGIKEKFDV